MDKSKCILCKSEMKNFRVTFYQHSICIRCHNILSKYGVNKKGLEKIGFWIYRQRDKSIEKLSYLLDVAKRENIPLYEYLLYEYPPDWEQRCQVVKERDNKLCCECGSANDLIVHHITPVNEGGNHFLYNLVTLCNNCHLNYHPEIKTKIQQEERIKNITICPIHNIPMKRFIMFYFGEMFPEEKELKLRKKHCFIYSGGREYYDENGETINYAFICPDCINVFAESEEDYEYNPDDILQVYIPGEGDKYINMKHVYFINNDKLESLDRAPGYACID